jgi:hypothetical protein
MYFIGRLPYSSELFFTSETPARGENPRVFSRGGYL